MIRRRLPGALVAALAGGLLACSPPQDTGGGEGAEPAGAVDPAPGAGEPLAEPEPPPLAALACSPTPADALVAALDDDDKGRRLSATQRLKTEFARDEAVVCRVLQQLAPDRFAELSPEGRVNVLFFLNSANPGRWDPRLVQAARRGVALLESRALGGQAAAELEAFDASLQGFERSVIHEVASPGIVVRELEVPALVSELVVAEIDPSAFSAQVVGVTPKSPSGVSAMASAKRDGATLVIGSGFVEAFAPPTPAGFLMVGGDLVNKVIPGGFETLVAVRDGKLSLLLHEQGLPGSLEGGFQTGPRLVEDGFVGELRKSKPATRSFVGLREDGTMVVGITKRPVRLEPLASYLRTTVSFGGLGCVDAVNLAGGGSEAFLYLDGSQAISYGNVNSRQASLLAFHRKGSGPSGSHSRPPSRSVPR